MYLSSEHAPRNLEAGFYGAGEDFSIGGNTSVVFISLTDVGSLPVLIYRGQVVREVAQWLVFEKQHKAMSPSALYQFATSVRDLTEFLVCYRDRCLSAPMLKAFFDARVEGNKELGWSAVSTKTCQRKIDAIERFIDWHSSENGLPSPNPLVSTPMSWSEWVIEAARRAKTDLLAHLFHSSTKRQNRRKRKYTPFRRAERGQIQHSAGENGFRFEDYLLLLRHESDPRNKMIWLCLGAGMRTCELLNMFVSDVGCDASGQCKLLLADPVYGPVDNNYSRRRDWVTRRAYLRDTFNTVPREDLRMNSTGWVGWKGMRFQEGATAGVTWLHPMLGHLAWKTHLEYMRDRGTACGGKHPWYLVNLTKNTGQFMSASNLKTLLRSRCHRLGFAPPFNPHSLRHMYVDFLVNVLKMTEAQAQILVRHRSIVSTQAYSAARKEMTRRVLEAISAGAPECQGLADLVREV